MKGRRRAGWGERGGRAEEGVEQQKIREGDITCCPSASCVLIRLCAWQRVPRETVAGIIISTVNRTKVTARRAQRPSHPLPSSDQARTLPHHADPRWSQPASDGTGRSWRSRRR